MKRYDAMLTQDDKQRFDECCRRILCSDRQRHGIGTLGERTLHAVLKSFFEPDSSYHEQKVGRYVADIKKGDSIIEIQTRAFGAMRKKLETFSKSCRVTVVFPIAAEKHVSWVDPESGELHARRRSPKPGKPWDILRELYALRPIMPLCNVRFALVFMSIDEFRLLNGWSRDKKRGSTRCERIPTSISDIVMLESTADFDVLIPPSLGNDFTAAEFAKAAKMTSRTAGYALQTLVTLGVIEHTKNLGRAYLYTKIFLGKEDEK